MPSPCGDIEWALPGPGGSRKLGACRKSLWSQSVPSGRPGSSVGSDRRPATFRLAVEYDGTDFHGWQLQKEHRSVQGDLETALRRLSTGAVRVTGAGRTDAGCHAAGQVASATVLTALGPDRLQRALNAILPGDVRIIEIAEVHPGFHARFDAMRRAYRYLIARRPTAIRRGYAWIHPVGADPAELDQVSRPLLGSHDFTSFTRQGSDTSDAQCRVMRARWSKGPGGLRLDRKSVV